MTSHLGYLVLFAGCVAAVFATLLRDGFREQVLFGARVFGALVGGAFVLGWAMYFAFR
jgi:hypothetical protein